MFNDYTKKDTNTSILDGEIKEFVEQNKVYPSGAVKNVFSIKLKAKDDEEPQEQMCVYWKRAENLTVGSKIQGRGWYLNDIFLFSSLFKIKE